jgi:hypothetical protein
MHVDIHCRHLMLAARALLTRTRWEVLLQCNSHLVNTDARRDSKTVAVHMSWKRIRGILESAKLSADGASRGGSSVSVSVSVSVISCCCGGGGGVHCAVQMTG